MSLYTITNNTNSRTATLANALAPGASSVTGYNQGGVAITGSAISNTPIESTTTGYKYSGTDIGNSFCAIYNDSAGPSSGTIPVSNYSSCTIVMVGGGGGGGGSTISTGPTINAGSGGDGGITILPKIPLSSVTSISYTVGSGGARGLGAQILTVPTRAATVGSAGNATTVTISTTTYTASAGNGGPTQSANAGNGTDGAITPTTQTVTTATLNGPLTYNATNRVINFSTTNYGQGGSGGNSISPLIGNQGQVGNPGYLRVYLYP